MKKTYFLKNSTVFYTLITVLVIPSIGNAQTDHAVSFFPNKSISISLWEFLFVVIAIAVVLYFAFKTKRYKDLYYINFEIHGR